MDRTEAENWIYASYLHAEKELPYAAPDALKRHPELTEPFLRDLSVAPAVVVTGSKGKGSVARMLSQILQVRHRTGLLTSPHISRFNERICVDGKPIPDEAFIRLAAGWKERFDPVAQALPPGMYISPMGIQAAIGLSWFNEQGTAFNVLEGGKGAQYDDVNNIPHGYAVINPVFLEHTRELGPTLEAIASDKAHVIRPGMKAVYVARQQPEALAVIERRAAECGVPVKRYGRDFQAVNMAFTPAGMRFDAVAGEDILPDVTIPLLGEHQAENAALALALGREILGGWNHPDIREKLSCVQVPGRMEVLSSQPLTLLDACINRESAAYVRAVLERLGLDRYVLIVGIPDDKDYEGVVLALKDKASEIILTRSGNPHYRFTDMQERTLSARGVPVRTTQSVVEALEVAREGAEPIVILGTTSVIAEVKSF